MTGLIGLAVSLLLLPKAFGLPQLPIVPIGPGFYPKLVLVFMAITSAILLLQDIVAQRRAGLAVSVDSQSPRRPAYDLVAATFAVVAGYIVLLPLIGFRLSTMVFVAAFQLMLERPRMPSQWAALLAVSIGTALVAYFVFERYLLVLLPRGAWTGW